ALEQTRGLASLCEHGLAEHFARLPEKKAELERAAGLALTALRGFADCLERSLLPRSRGDFRLGADRFRQKLQFVLEDEIEPDKIVAAARELLEKTQDEMAATSTELWPALFPGRPLPAAHSRDEKHALVRKVLDKLGTDHPTSANVVAASKQLLADAT